MKLMLTMIIGLLLAGAAQAGDVYVVTDDKGNRVYTDRPQTLPAERTGIRSSPTDPADVQAGSEEQMKQVAAVAGTTTNQQERGSDATTATESTTEDRDKRCADARKRYETLMFNFRIYEVGPDGERRYLDSAEIDTARVEAKKVLDEFCGEQ
jgi:hypothetical protein